MTKREVVVYIAMSLDGYIATEKGGIEWLSKVEVEGEDYGYRAFVDTVDTVIMGRKTYDKVMSFGIPFPHKDKKCYVISASRTGKNDNVEYYSGSLTDLIEGLKAQGGLNIYCDGGADIIHQLLKEELVDRLIISIVPVLLGGGIALFKKERPFQEILLQETKSYSTGLVQVEYSIA